MAYFIFSVAPRFSGVADHALADPAKSVAFPIDGVAMLEFGQAAQMTYGGRIVML